MIKNVVIQPLFVFLYSFSALGYMKSIVILFIKLVPSHESTHGLDHVNRLCDFVKLPELLLGFV